MIEIKVEDTPVKEMFRKMQSRIENTQPAMEQIAGIVKSSVLKNFMVGGRPKWKPSQRAIKEHGQTLRYTGVLMNSIDGHGYRDRAEVWTNVPYAATHQYGADINRLGRSGKLFFKAYKGGKRKGRTLFSRESKASYGKSVEYKPYSIHIEPRPFVMVQDEDWPVIGNAIMRFITEGTS